VRHEKQALPHAVSTGDRRRSRARGVDCLFRGKKCCKNGGAETSSSCEAENQSPGQGPPPRYEGTYAAVSKRIDYHVTVMGVSLLRDAVCIMKSKRKPLNRLRLMRVTSDIQAQNSSIRQSITANLT